jgi:glycerol-3-phosphate cytidylyltransferase
MHKMLRVGLTVGVWDYCHPGHVNFLLKCLASCDDLIVGVQRDPSEQKGTDATFSLEQRVSSVSTLSSRITAKPYDTVSEIANEVSFTVFLSGPDQTHEGFQSVFKLCEVEGFQIVTIPRTPGISSTSLRASSKTVD